MARYTTLAECILVCLLISVTALGCGTTSTQSTDEMPPTVGEVLSHPDGGPATDAATEGGPVVQNPASGRSGEGGRASNLLGYWMMDESSWSGAANEVKDSSGNNYHGTASSATTTNDGKYGRGGQFNGGGYVTNPSSISGQISNQFTAMTWVKKHTFNNYAGYVTNSDTYNDYGFRIGNDGNNRFRIVVMGNSGWAQILSDMSYTDMGWHHVAGVYNNTMMELYVDGVKQNYITYEPYGINNNPVMFGKEFTNVNNYYLNGVLDDVRVFNRALSGPEIVSFMNPAEVRLTGSSMCPSSVTQMDSNVCMAKVNLISKYKSIEVETIRTTLTGTASDGDISKVRLVEDNDGSGNFSSGDEVLDQGTFSDGEITFAGPWTVPKDSTTRLLVLYNIAADAKVGRKAGMCIRPGDVSISSQVSVSEQSVKVQSVNTTIKEKGDPLSVVLDDLMTNSLEQGSRNAPAVAATLTSPRLNISISSFALELDGSASAADIDGAYLHADSDGDGVFDPVTDQLVAHGHMAGATLTFEDLDLNVWTGEPETIFANIDVSLYAERGRTLGFRVEGEHITVHTPDTIGSFWPLSTVSSVISDVTRPEAPTGLTILDVTHESISIAWDRNPESDLQGYNIYRSTKSNPTSWGKPVNGDSLLPVESFLDAGLEELKTYHYVVTALDEVPNESDRSASVYTTTLLGPHGPEVNDAPEEMDILEDGTDAETINLKRWFTDVNGDELIFSAMGMDNINIAIDDWTGVVTVTPDPDWSGAEDVTFTAADETDSASHTIRINVIAVNDSPGPAAILSPGDGFKLWAGQAVTLTGACSDPDADFGDVLTFSWSSSLSGPLGEGAGLADITLQAGDHEVTLEVRDTTGLTSSATISIIVSPTAKTDTDGDGIPNLWELENGLDPYNPYDASGDPDGDGSTYLDDYNRDISGGPGTGGGTGDGGDDPGTGGSTTTSEGSSSGPSMLFVALMLLALIAVVVVVLLLMVRRSGDGPAQEHGDDADATPAPLPMASPPGPHPYSAGSTAYAASPHGQFGSGPGTAGVYGPGYSPSGHGAIGTGVAGPGQGAGISTALQLPPSQNAVIDVEPTPPTGAGSPYTPSRPPGSGGYL